MSDARPGARGPVHVEGEVVATKRIGAYRHLTLTAYVEWVLGTSRSSTAPFVATEIDPVTGGMLARNLWGGAETRVAFTDLGGLQTAWTGNRMEFIGRNGTLERPAPGASKLTMCRFGKYWMNGSHMSALQPMPGGSTSVTSTPTGSSSR